MRQAESYDSGGCDALVWETGAEILIDDGDGSMSSPESIAAWLPPLGPGSHIVRHAGQR
jgi:hypothetical protein